MTDSYNALADLADVPFDGASEVVQNAQQAALRFYAVDGRGRINLAGLVDTGAQFYQADKATNGVITLTPVEIVTTAQRTTKALA